MFLLVISGTACQQQYSSPKVSAESEEDILPPLVLNPQPLPELSLNGCVYVYYDKTITGTSKPLGKVYAIKLLNILGHFTEYQRHYRAVEDYVSGDLDKCGVNIFIDSNYYSVIPQDFLNEFKNQMEIIKAIIKPKMGATTIKPIIFSITGELITPKLPAAATAAPVKPPISV